MDSKFKHDFINNALRIEILNKLISEEMTEGRDLTQEYLEDLTMFINDHLDLLKKIK